ncbi:protein eyes shut-like [Ylistrum balloti]|uniref:protein eyes shut-like n=1 Tax=Ylistrum balloti TaxID=509963 RepID=UPI002905A438|nr:protein eyes shut-like [Ylistrum balloti]
MRFAVFYLLAMCYADANHFRGGTISWQPTRNGFEVEFKFRMGWTYGNGPGCTVSKIGQLVTGMSSSYWMCDKCSPNNIANLNYVCTAASSSENWEQGERTFRYTFPGPGPFTVSFTGSAWMALDFGSASGWNIYTTVDLRKRSDTNQPNQSPITASKPLYRMQSDCSHNLKIPMIDADGDVVKCRWSRGTECASVCRSLPDATLDQDTCTIHFTTDTSKKYRSGGWYAVAITVEDFPSSSITIGGAVFGPSRPLSVVPLQFLITAPQLSGPCNRRPVFVNPTPPEGHVISIKERQRLSIQISASSASRITDIQLTAPSGLTKSSLTISNGVGYITVTWVPTSAQKGTHILCAMADDSQGKTSDPRCLTLLAWDRDPCESFPCENNGTCSRVGFTEDFTCACVPGFTGKLCEIDINECQSSPCQNAGYCLDLIAKYECRCDAGYTGVNCEIDIDECLSQPCLHGGTCVDHVNHFTCTCGGGYTGALCQTEIDECLSNPCQNNATCVDLLNQYYCACVDGFIGAECQTDVDECVSSPCLMNGTCVDLVNGFKCICPGGWTGEYCQTGLPSCDSAPCLHGGSCENVFPDFICHCPTPWQGKICESRPSPMGKKCTGLQYTECDCFINSKKQKREVNYKLEFGAGGAAVGLVTSLLAYVVYNLCHSCEPGKLVRGPITRVRPLSSEDSETSINTPNDSIKPTKRSASARAMSPTPSNHNETSRQPRGNLTTSAVSDLGPSSNNHSSSTVRGLSTLSAVSNSEPASTDVSIPSSLGPTSNDVNSPSSSGPPSNDVNSLTILGPPSNDVNSLTVLGPPSNDVNSLTVLGPHSNDVNSLTILGPPSNDVNSLTALGPPSNDVNSLTALGLPSYDVNSPTALGPPSSDANTSAAVRPHYNDVSSLLVSNDIDTEHYSCLPMSSAVSALGPPNDILSVTTVVPPNCVYVAVLQLRDHLIT